MKAQTIPISKLRTNNGQIAGLPKNPRFIRDERFERLKQSINDLPSMLDLREIIVVPQNGHFVAIGGNMRLRAAKDLGLDKLPCKVLDADTPYGQSQDGVPNDDPELHRDLMLDAVGLLPIDSGVIIAFQSPRLFVNWLDALSVHNFKFERMLWMYKAAQCTFPWRGWILTSESILAATKGEGQWQDVHPYSHDCYYLPEVSGELAKDSGWHGAVKPLTVISDLLARICPAGSIVYEPFCGAGTTLVACQNLNRQCRAIELMPEYVAICLQRMTDAFPNIEIKRIEQAEAAGG